MCNTKKGGKIEILKFKGWLVEHQIKQSDLAELLGIAPENVNAKLNGRQEFTLSQVKKICDAYGISADDFFV